MPKVGDIVLYKVQNKVYNAIVLHVHQGQPDYLGTNGEPQLHVAFIAPDRETAITKNKFGYIPQIFYDYDVVHASHEFSADFKKDQGLKTEAEIKTRRGQGEWENVESAERLRGLLEVEQKACHELLEEKIHLLNERTQMADAIASLTSQRDEAVRNSILAPAPVTKVLVPLDTVLLSDANAVVPVTELIDAAPPAPPLHEVPVDDSTEIRH